MRGSRKNERFHSDSTYTEQCYEQPARFRFIGRASVHHTSSQPSQDHGRQRGEASIKLIRCSDDVYRIQILTDMDRLLVLYSQLSLTSSSRSPKSGEFLEIFKSLLDHAGTTSEALGNTKADSSDRQSIEEWLRLATSLEPLPMEQLDLHLSNKTYIADGKLTAADVAVFGALHSYIVRMNSTFLETLNSSKLSKGVSSPKLPTIRYYRIRILRDTSI